MARNDRKKRWVKDALEDGPGTASELAARINQHRSGHQTLSRQQVAAYATTIGTVIRKEGRTNVYALPPQEEPA